MYRCGGINREFDVGGFEEKEDDLDDLDDFDDDLLLEEP